MPWILRDLVRRTFASCFLGLCWNQAGVPWKCAVSAAGRKRTPFETSIISCECLIAFVLWLFKEVPVFPRPFSLGCDLPHAQCLFFVAPELQKVWITNRATIWRRRCGDRLSGVQSISQCSVIFTSRWTCVWFFISFFHSQWPMMIGVLWWCSVHLFSVPSTEAQVDSIQVALPRST